MTLSVAGLLASKKAKSPVLGVSMPGWAADTVACADGSEADGATAASPAQAGTTISANNNSNRFFIFMVTPLCS